MVLPTPTPCKQDSTIASSSFSWDNSREPWRHVAVTVAQNVASRHNIFFYVDAWIEVDLTKPAWKGLVWEFLCKSVLIKRVF